MRTPDIIETANFGLGPILQDAVPDVPWSKAHTRKLPGIEPLDIGDWLRIDSAFDRQMQLRDLLASTHNTEVVQCLPTAENAANELLQVVISYLSKQSAYSVQEGQVVRPDGVVVSVSEPMDSLMRLVAEDFCILEKQGNEHVLVAASLGFPAGWTLAQKMGKPMVRIHRPVVPYGDDIARRVQRMFDGLRAGAGLVRMNAHRSASCELFRVVDENEPYEKNRELDRPYIRTERQCLLKLPQSGAVVFSIHTRMILDSALSHEQALELAEFPIRAESRDA